MTSVGILGGTGAIGRAIGARLAAAGHSVTLGSRDAERASSVAAAMRSTWDIPIDHLGAGSWADAASADLVVIALPADALVDLGPLASALGGKTVLSAVNVLERGDTEFTAVTGDSPLRLLEELVPDARFATAFNHLAAKPFGDPTVKFDADVLVAGHPTAVADGATLIDTVPGLRPVDAGGFGAAAVIEAFTSVLLNVNVRSGRIHGIRLVCPE